MLLCALGLLLVKSAFIIWTPLRALTMSNWLIDDSFIVARVARNIALGHGFSFDGTHPTTGVSMLWTYLTSVPHLFFVKDAAFKATLILSTVFGSLCTVASFFIGEKLGGTRAGWIAFLLTSLMPVLFFNAMNGMETSFFSLFVILALAAGSGTWTISMNPMRQGLWTGLFAGIAILTRADAIFLIAALVLLHGWTFWKNPHLRKDTVRQLIGFMIAAGLCFLVLLGWQMVLTGSPFPDNQIGRRAIALQKHQFDYAQFSLPTWIKIVVWNFFEADALWTIALGSSLLGLLGFILALLHKETSRIAGLTGVYLMLFCAMLVCWQWYFPDFHGLRYFNGGAHILFVFIALMIAKIDASFWSKVAGLGMCAVMIVLGWYRFYDYARGFPAMKQMSIFGQRSTDTQNAFWGMIDAINKDIPEDAVIAARDHGRLAFFTDRPVQDLAGILDPAILTHLSNNSVGPYFTERSVDFTLLPAPLAGSPSIYQVVHESLSLELMNNIPAQEITGYRIYRVLP